MILLLTHSGDYFTIDRVQQALGELGREHRRINTDLFPTYQQIVCRFPQAEMLLCLEEETIPLGEVSAVWSRRLWPGALPPGLTPEVEVQLSQTCRTAYQDTLMGLTQAYWLNPIEEGFRAESKLLQLRVASEVGLRVPETLVTNRPEEVRDFFQAHPDGIITKLLEPTAVAMGADANFSYTCLVQEEHLQGLDTLRVRPQIFQPFLRKRHEYRVVVVGHRFFVGGMSIPQEGPLAVDWRQAQPGELEWFQADLPEPVKEKVLRLMEQLGLGFGALDFIDTGEGEPHFLEINQAGEWGMLERDLELPIARAIAEELAS